MSSKFKAPILSNTDPVSILKNSDRPDRPERQDKPDRQDKPERSERENKSINLDKPDRQDKPERSDRQDKPERSERENKSERDIRHSSLTRRSSRRNDETKEYLGDSGETILTNGEKIPKNSRIISAIGVLEELSAYIGIIKAEHLNAGTERKFDIANSTKVFLFGWLTQIQETLADIITSISVSNKNSIRYETSRFDGEQKIKDLEQQITQMKSYESVDWPTNPKSAIIAGSSVLEAQLLYARTICRRSERQVVSSKNISLGFIPDKSVLAYLNRLGDYLLTLAIHTLHLHSKEPMKRTGTKRSNREPSPARRQY